MNVSGHISGTTETPLTEEGRQQAKRAGRAAKKLNIDLIVCSPLGRAHETAKIIAKEIGYPINKIQTNGLLIERHFGVMEGQLREPDHDADGFADVESRDTLMNRAKQAIDWLHSLPAQHILVVSHGTFGRAVRSLLKPEIPFDHSRLQNAEIHHWL
ncbi:histidine phosphatase family protein [Candidatus Saccharibacteria bacterium]|nr:histidine phosphatase family protein [Candidatus Saccharibacteria bacterium]